MVSYETECLLSEGCRRFSNDLHQFFCCGVIKAQFSCVKADLLSLSPSCSVLHITLDRMTNGRELCPDLVVSTGMQLNFNQRIIVASFQNMITQSSFFGPFFRAFENNGFVVLAMFFSRSASGRFFREVGPPQLPSKFFESAVP